MSKIKENWQIVVFTMFVTLFGSLLLSWYQGKNSAIKNAASVEYVDTKDNELKSIDISLQLKLDTKADKDQVDKMSKQIDFIYQEALTRANRKDK